MIESLLNSDTAMTLLTAGIFAATAFTAWMNWADRRGAVFLDCEPHISRKHVGLPPSTVLYVTVVNTTPARAHLKRIKVRRGPFLIAPVGDLSGRPPSREIKLRDIVQPSTRGDHIEIEVFSRPQSWLASWLFSERRLRIALEIYQYRGKPRRRWATADQILNPMNMRPAELSQSIA
jgi:hypothetical protein